MWSKIYVGIIVLIILVFLHIINTTVHYIDKLYNLNSKYGIPIDCFSTAVCVMNGNILLLFVIYLIIPDEYYERVLRLLNPHEIHKSASDDVLGINKIATQINSQFLKKK